MAKKNLYGLDNELLEGIDKEVLLNTAINLLKGLNFDALTEELTNGSGDFGGLAVLTVLLAILFILLMINA